MVRTQAPFSPSPKGGPGGGGADRLTISRLAEAGGVGVETVRYYQRRGLLPEPPRAGAIRRYGGDDVRRLRFIRRAQSAGFTLEEIGELLAASDHIGAAHGRGGGCGAERGRVRALAEARVAALESKIADLERARTALHRLSRACAEGEEGPCPILEAFEA